jgi:peptidoglycan/LPS O-acetylase OafA/YrhL
LVVISNRNIGLDAVRAFAILLVLIHHFITIVPLGLLPLSVDTFLILGYFGVEIFFVLSGFLIGNILLKIFLTTSFDFNDLKTFWIRRWLRTLPLYFALLVVHVLLFWETNLKPEETWEYIFFLQNFFQYDNPFYGITWSLSVEEWFYLSFPLTLFVMRRMNQKAERVSVLKSTILIYIFSFLGMRIIQSSFFDVHWNNDIRKSVFLRLDSIGYGVLFAFVFNVMRQSWEKFRWPMFIIGALLTFTSSIYFLTNVAYDYTRSGHVDFFGDTVYLSVVSIAFGLMFPVIHKLRIGNRPLNWIVTYVSKISYSLYLVHLFSLDLTRNLVPTLFGVKHTLLAFVVFMCLSLSMSTITYYLIELTFLKLRDAYWAPRLSAAPERR